MEYSIKRSIIERITIDHLGVDADKVTDDASFIDDLGADSLDIVELVMAFEEEFDEQLPDEHIEKIDTVGDLTSYFCTPMEQRENWQPKPPPKPRWVREEEEMLIALRDSIFTVDFMRGLLAKAKRIEDNKACKARNASLY